MTKEDIKNILRSKEGIVRKFKVRSISLFGSYVRNEQKADSDIDFLVDFEDGATLFDLVNLQDVLLEIFKKKVSVVSKKGLNKYIGPYILKEAELIG